MKKVLFWSVWLLLATQPLLAQGTTFQEQSNRLQNINAYLLDFRANGPPLRLDRSRFEAVLDIQPQPSINTRVGNKEEPVDPPSVVPKVRARYHHSSGLMIGAAFAPGIEFQDYKAEFIAAELGYRMKFGDWHGGLRVSYSDGEVEGPITEEGVEDLFDYKNVGGDLSLGRTFGEWVVYGFVGANDIETSLEIEADRARLANTDSTYYYGAGLGYEWKKFYVNLEQNLTDDYLAHLVLSFSYRF